MCRDAAHGGYIAQTYSQCLMSQPSWDGVFKLEIDLFDQQIDRRKRHAPFALSQDRAVIANPKDEVRGFLLRRLLANTFDKFKFASHENLMKQQPKWRVYAAILARHHTRCRDPRVQVMKWRSL